jgi:hypothetical protein
MDTIGNSERITVSYCTKPTHGSRVMPAGTLTGVHFVKTPDYIQITGQGDFTKINISAGDDGGELDNRGADVRLVAPSDANSTDSLTGEWKSDWRSSLR